MDTTGGKTHSDMRAVLKLMLTRSLDILDGIGRMLERVSQCVRTEPLPPGLNTTKLSDGELRLLADTADCSVLNDELLQCIRDPSRVDNIKRVKGALEMIVTQNELFSGAASSKDTMQECVNGLKRALKDLETNQMYSKKDLRMVNPELWQRESPWPSFVRHEDVQDDAQDDSQSFAALSPAAQAARRVYLRISDLVDSGVVRHDELRAAKYIPFPVDDKSVNMVSAQANSDIVARLAYQPTFPHWMHTPALLMLLSAEPDTRRLESLETQLAELSVTQEQDAAVRSSGMADIEDAWEDESLQKQCRVSKDKSRYGERRERRTVKQFREEREKSVHVQGLEQDRDKERHAIDILGTDHHLPCRSNSLHVMQKYLTILAVHESSVSSMDVVDPLRSAESERAQTILQQHGKHMKGLVKQMHEAVRTRDVFESVRRHSDLQSFDDVPPFETDNNEFLEISRSMRELERDYTASYLQLLEMQIVRLSNIPQRAERYFGSALGSPMFPIPNANLGIDEVAGVLRARRKMCEIRNMVFSADDKGQTGPFPIREIFGDAVNSDLAMLLADTHRVLVDNPRGAVNSDLAVQRLWEYDACVTNAIYYYLAFFQWWQMCRDSESESPSEAEEQTKPTPKSWRRLMEVDTAMEDEKFEVGDPANDDFAAGEPGEYTRVRIFDSQGLRKMVNAGTLERAEEEIGTLKTRAVSKFRHPLDFKIRRRLTFTLADLIDVGNLPPGTIRPVNMEFPTTRCDADLLCPDTVTAVMLEGHDPECLLNCIVQSVEVRVDAVESPVKLMFGSSLQDFIIAHAADFGAETPMTEHTTLHRHSRSLGYDPDRDNKYYACPEDARYDVVGLAIDPDETPGDEWDNLRRPAYHTTSEDINAFGPVGAMDGVLLNGVSFVQLPDGLDEDGKPSAGPGYEAALVPETLALADILKVRMQAFQDVRYYRHLEGSDTETRRWLCVPAEHARMIAQQASAQILERSPVENLHRDILRLRLAPAEYDDTVVWRKHIQEDGHTLLSKSFLREHEPEWTIDVTKEFSVTVTLRIMLSVFDPPPPHEAACCVSNKLAGKYSGAVQLQNPCHESVLRRAERQQWLSTRAEAHAHKQKLEQKRMADEAAKQAAHVLEQAQQQAQAQKQQELRLRADSDDDSQMCD